MAKIIECGLEVSTFEFQSRYYVHFPTNTLRKGIENLLSFQLRGQITLLLFYKSGFGVK